MRSSLVADVVAKSVEASYVVDDAASVEVDVRTVVVSKSGNVVVDLESVNDVILLCSLGN